MEGTAFTVGFLFGILMTVVLTTLVLLPINTKRSWEELAAGEAACELRTQANKETRWECRYIKK
jgi:hypothetical protein